MSKFFNKKNIIICAVVLVIALLVIVVGMTFGMGAKANVNYNLLNYEKSLTAKEVKRDIKDLILNIDRTHPLLTMKDVDENIIKNYNAKKAEMLAIDKEMTVLELQFLMSELLATFQDLHTQSWIGNNTAYPLLFDFSMKFDAGVVDAPNPRWIVSSDSKEQLNVGIELTHIGGKSTQSIINDLSKFVGMENDFSVVFIANYISYASILQKIGCEFENNQIEFKFSDGSSRLLRIRTTADFTPGGAIGEPIANFSTKRLDDGSFYVRMRSMQDDGSYNTMLDEVKAELSSGGKRFVVDVTNNTGGSDGFAYELLSTLGFKVSDLGFYNRYSINTRKYYGTIALTGDKYYEPYYRSENTKNIQLKVVSNENSMSAAMAMIAQVKFSNYGEIIGRASAQSPNFCGNVIPFQSKHSKIVYSLPTSYGYYIQDGKKVGNIIKPDIEVDSFDTNILKYIKW